MTDTSTSTSRFLQKVISGGQTGIDRIGLEAARDVGLATGGTTPKNFMTCDGQDLSLRDVFGLTELNTNSNTSTSLAQQYVLRSQKNVDDADAVIVFRMKPSVGTDKTIGYAQTKRWCMSSNSNSSPYKPYCIINVNDDTSIERNKLDKFLLQVKPRVVNIVGHRDDKSEEIQRFMQEAHTLLIEIFKKYSILS